ncbi:MAG: hypothetical protein HW420_725, partial [Candidatus Nitrosotenuis sp.]|nr:hypothetical protein [Candidatus Nitrosotenuis sp.]
MKKLEIQGAAPFKQSGVYEVQISVCNTPPSAEEIKSKRFSALWQDIFHLHVKDNAFSQVLGSDSNPVPAPVFDLSSVWIVVRDQFSSLYSVFEVQIGPSDDVPQPRQRRTREPAAEPIESVLSHDDKKYGVREERG